jgi:hypothetical protein
MKKTTSMVMSQNLSKLTQRGTIIIHNDARKKQNHERDFFQTTIIIIINVGAKYFKLENIMLFYLCFNIFGRIFSC